MSQYNYNYENSQDELMHYGVKGMRWGVRRASKMLTKATTSEQRDAAVAKLNKHRTKASNEIAKLQKRRPKLDETLAKSASKDATKAAKLETKAAKLDQKIAKNQKKAAGFFTRESKAEKLLAKNQVMQNKSNVLHTKAKNLEANYKKAKAAVEANETMQQAFRKGVNDIDDALLRAGRKYVNG